LIVCLFATILYTIWFYCDVNDVIRFYVTEYFFFQHYSVLSGLKVIRTAKLHRAVRITAARNKHCKQLTSSRIWTCGFWIW